jgi:hypothetical protein
MQKGHGGKPMAFDVELVSVYFIERERRKSPRSGAADLVVERVVGGNAWKLSFQNSEKVNITHIFGKHSIRKRISPVQTTKKSGGQVTIIIEQ